MMLHGKHKNDTLNYTKSTLVLGLCTSVDGFVKKASDFRELHVEWLNVEVKCQKFEKNLNFRMVS